MNERASLGIDLSFFFLLLRFDTAVTPRLAVISSGR